MISGHQPTWPITRAKQRVSLYFWPIVPASFLIVCLLISATESESLPSSQTAQLAAETYTCRIDPNTAPWWEMTVLPRIGQATAKRIVDYRDEHKGLNSDCIIYHSAQDLDPIRGIGPKTIEKLRPYLRFPPQSTDSPSNPVGSG